jgi:hypothetical protein
MTRRPPRRVAVGPDRWKELGQGCAVLILVVVAVLLAARLIVALTGAGR